MQSRFLKISGCSAMSCRIEAWTSPRKAGLVRGQLSPVPVPRGSRQAEVVGGAGVGSGGGVGFGVGVGMMVGVGVGVGDPGGSVETGLGVGDGAPGAPGADGSSSTMFLMQPPVTSMTATASGNARDNTFMGDPQA
jgi:hypothetical protein